MTPARLSRTAGLAALGFAASTVLIHCAKDDRQGVAVLEIKDCPNLADLSDDPTSPFATLRVFVEVAEELKAKSADVDQRLAAACTELDTELGLPIANGSVPACQSLSKRMEAVIKSAPPPPAGPLPPSWVELSYPAFCKHDRSVQAACLAKCAGPCDVSTCDPKKLVGVCDGDCKGDCSTVGVEAACTGKCEGTCAGLDKSDCTGECVGQCGNGSFVGQCESGCSVSAAGFFGVCSGLCTGVCNGAPIGMPIKAGDAGDAGDGGAPEAGPGTGGSCAGTCIGYCSSQASGVCAGACTGSFAGGSCVGACTGKCGSGSAGTPCSTTCTGICTKPAGPACAGTCHGGCSVPLREPACEGSLECGQNIECRNACNAKAEAAITCTPTDDFQVFGVGDDALYKALKKHGAALGALAQEIDSLRNAQSFIAERAPSDFAALGANNDLARACAARGIMANTDALNTIRNLINANPTTRKYSL